MLLVMVLNPGVAPGWYHCYLRTSGGRQAFAGAFHVGRDGGVWVIRPHMPPRDLAGARLGAGAPGSEGVLGEAGYVEGVWIGEASYAAVGMSVEVDVAAEVVGAVVAERSK